MRAARGLSKALTRAVAALWFMSAIALAAPAAHPLRVVHPRPASDTDTRGAYYVELIDLAMRRAGVAYTRRPHPNRMVGARLIKMLGEGDEMDVIWAPTTRQFEQALMPIRIPIDKGMLGWRIFLINKRDRDLFASIKTIEQLRRYPAGQARDWPDTTILRANGLEVKDAVTYDDMFQMLAADRFKFFPRGVAEIWAEAKNNAGLDLEVEQHLALHYPSYTYFFVSKQNPRLGAALERGLRGAIKDGSFDKLFEKYNGDLIRRAHLDTRIVFELKNPLFPEIKSVAPGMRGAARLF